jgi:hypothetical protein
MFTNLAPGQHRFQVVAVDESGNKQVPPTTFTWTIQEAVDPATAIQDLIMDIRTLDGVNFFVKLVLISQLRFALFFVNNGNDVSACGTMNTFIATVTSLENSGRLTEAQADDLIQQAQAIRDAIGCFSSNAMQANEAAGLTSTPQSSAGNPNNIPSAMSLPH